MTRARSLGCALLLLLVLALVVACAPAAAPTPAPPPTATKAPVVPASPTAAVPAPAKPTPAPVKPTPAPPVAEKPQPGGVLTLRAQADPEHLDIQQQGSVIALNPIGPCYSNLLRYDPLENTKVIPDLATEWSVSDDGLVYTFKLRQGVKWHDGQPFTAADVQATFDRGIKPPRGTVTPRWSAIKAMAQDWAMVDPYTFKVTLKGPSASFLPFLAVDFMMIMPKHVLEAKGDLKKDVVGTGAFKFKSYKRSVSFEVVKNPDYFLPERPYLDVMLTYILPDPGTAMAAFRTRRILTLATYPYVKPSELRELQAEFGDKVKIGTYPVGGSVRLCINTKKTPWGDQRVRKAVHLALDRQAAVKALTEGTGAIGAPFDPRTEWSIPLDELLKMPGYRQPKDADLAEAKRLLAEAGFPNGFKSSIMARSYPDYVNASIFIAEQLRKIGIDLGSVKVMESAAGYAALNAGDFDTEGESVGFIIGDPDALITELYLATSGRNYGKYYNEKVEKLFEQESRTLDVQKRKQLIREMQLILLDDPPYGFLYMSTSNDAWWEDVRGYQSGQTIYTNIKYIDVWLKK